MVNDSFVILLRQQGACTLAHTMPDITLDGCTFSSEWIDTFIAPYKDRTQIWGDRQKRLRDEIAMRESDLDSMLRTMPKDICGHAHLKAYISALQKTEEELRAELSERRR
jgi:hypothetical protein